MNKELKLYSWTTGDTYMGFYVNVIAESVEEARQFLKENPIVKGNIKYGMEYNLLERSYGKKTWLDEIMKREPNVFNLTKNSAFGLNHGTG